MSAFDASLELLRSLPPHQTEANLDRLVRQQPELEAELRNAVDVPCKVMLCPKAQREFLACEYNRAGDAYRYKNKCFDAFFLCFVKIAVVE